MPKFQCNDGTNLFFTVKGQGSPVVLISGGFCDYQVWDDVVRLLSQTYQVIVYDHRGTGQSDVSDCDYTVALLARDLDSLLAHLKIRSAHIIGHSMGGFVAQYFAAYYPKKTASLSLLSSLLRMNMAGHAYLDALINDAKSASDKLRRQMPELAGQYQSIQHVGWDAIPASLTMLGLHPSLRATCHL